ncbi:Beta-glucosidase B [Penicillium subrubescens]|uniref:Beta-glucosidase B n=1 Tax=Penicillium subrubescens TaxID=1316194 RepID=UPI0025452764|nr:Beta-glucosidase B [Penicillium subrubescens]KAJ5883467.1 Beta-glucosidase B [Penicillium subrubescens]
MTSTIDIEVVLNTLTLEEKVSLLSGQSLFETRSIPGKVPYVKVSDGPNGARGASFVGTNSAACFPAACCLAATFDANLAHQVGEALGEEAHTKGIRCLLAPTLCNHRHPLGGRNFEAFSEDPLLTGQLATELVRGIQSKGIAATIKHFVANEQETERMRVNAVIDERALREIYLRPFEIAIKEARPWAVMTAYNMLNGEHCDSNEFLLQKVLRGEWGWDGLVMSDWGGTNSSAGSLNAGMNLEMPGPGRHRTVSAVLKDIEEGRVTVGTVDDSVRDHLRFLGRVGAFTDPTEHPEQAIDRVEHRQLIRDVGARGSVLLKNNGVLPLSRDKVAGKRVALLGFAKKTLAHGGGSAAVKAHYKISPWAAMQEAIGDIAELSYSKGAHTERFLPPVTDTTDIGILTGLDGTTGWTQLVYDSKTHVLVSTTHGLPISKLAPFDPSGYGHIIEYVADLVPKESGSHYFGTSGIGPTQTFVNDDLIYEQTSHTADSMGFIFGLQAEGVASYPLLAGTKYRLRIRTLPCPAVPGLQMLTGRPGFRFGMSVAAQFDADLLSEAIGLAQVADFAVVFTGHTEQWETEGQDQVSFNLPKDGSQDALVSAVASVNCNTIVVNSTGVPVAMPWVENVAAIVQAWFGGQEAGASIVDILTGAVNPEGRLPVTFPKSIEDAPAYGNFPGTYVENDPTVYYEEGIFVGYRHYDRIPKTKVNFPFGYGLSYSTFEFGDLKITPRHDDCYSICVSVKNTSKLAGGTLVQIYAGFTGTDPYHPIKALVAFAKVSLEPGQSRTVTVSVPTRHLAYFDEQYRKWLVRPGEYMFTLGDSVAKAIKTAKVFVEKKIVYEL